MDERENVLELPRPPAAKEPEKDFAAIRTGFQRTDERTGRTLQIFICSEMEETKYDGMRPSEQPWIFFCEADQASGSRVFCSLCHKRHRVVSMIDSIIQGRIHVRVNDDGWAATINSQDLIAAVLEAARPKAVTR